MFQIVISIPDKYFKKVIKLFKCGCLRRNKKALNISLNEFKESNFPEKEEENLEKSKAKLINGAKKIQDQVTLE